MDSQIPSRTSDPFPARHVIHAYLFISDTWRKMQLADELPLLSAMDIARPEFKERKRRRQILIVAAVALGVIALTVVVYRLRPAAPTVERGTVWTDSVKRGPMLRQGRGI